MSRLFRFQFLFYFVFVSGAARVVFEATGSDGSELEGETASRWPTFFVMGITHARLQAAPAHHAGKEGSL